MEEHLLISARMMVSKDRVVAYSTLVTRDELKGMSPACLQRLFGERMTPIILAAKGLL